MTGSEDLQKAQIVLCLECPTRHSIDGITGQLFGFERCLTWKGDSLSGDLIADPVTDPISITSPLLTVSVCFGAGMQELEREETYHDRSNASIDDVRKGRDETAGAFYIKLNLVRKNLKETLTVSCFAELIAGCISAFLVCASSANRRGYRRIREVLIIRFRWIWIITRCANVIDVKIRFRTQWPFQALVADVIRLDTIGIATRSAASFKGWYTPIVESI